MKNKLRNLLLASLCLAVFTGAGIFFYTSWAFKKPFAIVLFLVPEMDASVLAASRLYLGGADARLAVEDFSRLFLLRTLPGESAGSSGELVRAIALDDLEGGGAASLFETARQRGRAIGFVTNAHLTSPTLAAFYAPHADPHDPSQLASHLLEHSRPEVLLGGGESDFLPEIKGGSRRDGQDLMLQARQSGYDIVRNSSELANTPTWRAPRTLGIFSPESLTHAESVVANPAEPSFVTMIISAIQLLQFQHKGYLLVIDCGLAREAARENRGERLLREILRVNDAIRSARAYTGEDSVFVVAGISSQGGFRLNSPMFRRDSGLAVMGTSPEGIPAVTWATGPGKEQDPPEPVAVSFAEARPIATDLPAFWQYGSRVKRESFQRMSGFLDARELGRRLREEL